MLDYQKMNKLPIYCLNKSLKFLSHKSPDLFIMMIYYWWLSGKESTCNAGDAKNTLPWRRKWKLAPVFLPGKFHGQRSLVGYSPRGHKESDTTECMSIHTHTHDLLLKKESFLFL